MSLPPTTTTPPTPAPRFNETTLAIAGAFVIALVLGTLVTGNPFRAIVLAYTDYSGTPAAGAAKASTTRAPATAPEVKAETNGNK